jgi:hypothetical protein
LYYYDKSDVQYASLEADIKFNDDAKHFSVECKAHLRPLNNAMAEMIRFKGAVEEALMLVKLQGRKLVVYDEPTEEETIDVLS